MGEMDAALDHGRMVRADTGNRAWQLVGLLRAWLGWLVVLGPGRKCLIDAMAGSHRAAAFCYCCGKAGTVKKLDSAVGNSGLFAVTGRHLYRALRVIDIGA